MNNIHELKIELIPVFITIIDTLSITETARKLGVTQSAVSHSLKKLRQQLNDELVIRDGNRLSPTAKAEKMYPSLKRWLGELDHIIDTVDFDPSTSHKMFYISTTDIVEQMFFPKIIRFLNEEAAGIGVRLIPWNADTVYAQLMNSEIDMAIGVRNFDYPNLMQKILYKETFISAARKGHPYFKSKRGLENFLSYPHTMTSSGDRAKGVVDTALQRLNRKRNLTHTVSNFSSAPFVVENSDCILTAPSRFLKMCAKRHNIQTFIPPLNLPTFEVKTFWTKKTHNDQANVWLREVLYNIFAHSLK